MARQTVRVRGYREFLAACDRAGKESKSFVRGTYRAVGDLVKVDAAGRIVDHDAKTAAGFRTYVRRTGVSVEQSLRKTTGQHPEYGAWQMRHGLEPALAAKETEVEGAMEKAIDKVADHFDRKG